MNKLWQKIMLFMVSVILGIILMTQIRTTNNVIGNETFHNKASELNSELATLTLEKNKLREELDQLKEISKKNEEEYEKKEEEIKKLEEELKKLKVLSGLYDVKGRGTIITIDAEPNAASIAYGHQYILALISYLNNAAVEAISINGQRYTTFTEIVPVLDHININGVAMVLPLEIKAIGFPNTIEASLNFVGGIITQLENIGYTVEIENSDEVFINRYEGEIKFKYAIPVYAEDEDM